MIEVDSPDRLTLLRGEEGAARIDASGERSIGARLRQLVSFAIADQMPDFAVYEAAALDGRSVIGVQVDDDAEKETARGILKARGGHFINRYGSWMTEELDVWRGLRVGSSVRVRYLEEDPGRWIVAGQRISRMPYGVAYLVSGVLGVIALICAFAISHQRSLLVEGRAAPAVVTELKKHHGTHGSSYREMRYEFPLLDGGVATGKAGASKTSAVGATLVVLYDPNNPHRNHPYPFSLVTPHEW